MRRGRTWAIGAVVVLVLGLPGAAASRTYRTSFQLQQVTPLGVWSETSGLPFLFPFGPVYRYRLGAHTYVGLWVASSYSRGSTSESLGEVYRDAVGRFPQGNKGVIIDRRMTAVENTRFKVLVDLYRDGDVLVVAAGHPACAGLTIAQARLIANGGIRNWSAVVAGPVVDPIALRFLSSGTEFPIPRMGTRVVKVGRKFRINYAPGGKAAADGGVGEAASGNQAIAAITTWSRLRVVRPGICAVPLNGVAPSNQTVADLSYPGAFPVSYVVTRKLAGRGAIGRNVNAVMRRAMKAKLETEGRTRLRQRGLLVVGDPLPPG